MHHARVSFRSAVAAVFWLASALAALAQATPATTPTKEDVVTLETFVVTSTEWNAIQEVIDTRRQSVRLTDAVASNDLGVLPDFNIGENLQRLPGISIELDQAEARYVTVRGFSPNYSSVTINGSMIAATERNTRRVEMDALPASLASSIEVTKTQTPDMEGHSVGGSIDIKGPRAIRSKPLTVKVNSKIGWYTNDEGFNGSGPSGSADVLVTRNFLDGKMGLAVSANYYLRNSYTPQEEYGSSRLWYTDAGVRVSTPYGGNGYAVPVERRLYWYHNNRERKGGSVKWEYNPTADLSLWALGFYNTATDDEARQTDLLTWNTSTAISGQTATSGTLTNNSMLQQQFLGKFDFERTIGGIQAGADLRLGEHQLSGRLNYSGSFFNNPENWNEWRQSGNQLAVRYRVDGDVIHFEDVNPAARANLAAYAPFRRQFDRRNLREDVYEAALDFTSRIGRVEGLNYKIGGKFRRIERKFDENRDRYLPVSGNTYNLAAAGVVRSDLILQTPGALAGQSILVIDPTRSRESFAAHLAANPAQWNSDPMTTDDNNLDYSAVEDVSAGYVQGEYRKNRLTVIGGVRYEDTAEEGTGRVLRAGVWGSNTTTGGYENWMPSVVANYDITKRNRLVVGVSKTIGRPAFNQFAPVGESINDLVAGLTIRRSNPDLKPRQSTNASVTLDHYFAEKAGYVSVGAFMADVKDEIFTATSQLDVILDGVEREATVTQPSNVDRPYRVQGLEFAFVRSLDFLPRPLDGFKLNANLTLIDSDFAIRMSNGTYFQTIAPFGAPKRAWNLALLYDKKKFSAKLAWNSTGMKLTERINVDDSYRNRYDSAVTRVTASASYRLNKNWLVNVSGWNLTGVGRKEVLGRDQEIPIVIADFGAAYFVGFTYSFK
ncbi:MAG TPA: TonB-dependent receptor [Lacunisphaera sp.]